MSEMAIFHGYFQKSIFSLNSDTGADLEHVSSFIGRVNGEEHHFVKVGDDFYEFWSSNMDMDADGWLAEVLPDTSYSQLLLLWDNDAMGMHDVAASAIERHLKGSH